MKDKPRRSAKKQKTKKPQLKSCALEGRFDRRFKNVEK